MSSVVKSCAPPLPLVVKIDFTHNQPLEWNRMLAAQRSGVTPYLSSASSRENSLDWREIVAPAEPFLQAVSDRLAAQIGAFDPEIAGYAEYALTGQGKQLRPA